MSVPLFGLRCSSATANTRCGSLPIPNRRRGGAVLQVEAVGLCGSDLAQFHGGVGVPGEKFPVVPGLWGGYGEQMVLRSRTNLHKLPETIAAEELTMFEPLANAVHWVQRAGVQLGDTVVIQGPGHQGLACLIAARAAGAGLIIVTGTTADAVRFDAARAWCGCRHRRRAG